VPNRLDDVIALLARIAAAAEAPAVEGLDAADAARFCGVSRSKWLAMSNAGHCPAPVELGDRCPRWLRSELNAWLRAGAPTRTTWKQIRESSLRRAG
jgi:predicted DNA-binding transcriptional regulator AlpA